MSDIEADAKLDVGQVLQGLRLMTSELNNATLAMKKLNDQGDKTKRTLKDNLKDAGGVAGKAGGPVGSFTSKLLSGSSMDGVFGRMAAGLGVATLAFRAYQSVIEAALDRTRLFIEAQRNMRAVTEQTKTAVDAQARRGEAQAAGRIDAIANGGQSAANDIEMLTGSGGATPEQANEAVSTIYGRFGNTARARNAVDTTMRGTLGGLSAPEVAKNLTQMGAAVDNNDQVDRMLGRMSQLQTGRVGDPQQIWLERMRNLNGDEVTMKARQNSAARSVIPGMERAAFLKSSLANSDLADQSSSSKLQLDAFNKMAQVMEELKLQAKAQGTVNGFLADIFQPGGSFETQMRRLAIANAQAQGLPTNDSTPPPPKPILNLTQGQPFGGGR